MNAQGDLVVSARGGTPEVKVASRDRFVRTAERNRACYAYFQCHKGITALVIVECDGRGELLYSHRISVNELQVATAVISIRRIGPDGIFVECHVNPSLSMGVAVDLPTGRSRLFQGAGFVWGPNGRHVAYFVDPPHYGVPHDAPAQVYIYDRPMLTLPRTGPRDLSWRAAGDELQVRYTDASGKDHVLRVPR